MAIQAGKDYAKRTSDAMYHVLTLVRFGRFDEVVELTKRPEREIPAAAFDFAHGLREAEARRAGLREGVSRQGEEGRRDVEAASSARTRRTRLVGVLAGILDGEITRMGGDVAGAIAKFEQRREARRRDGVRRARAAALPGAPLARRGADRSEALQPMPRRVYREDLKEHPHNGWSLLGLQQALKGQGKTDPAVDADLAKSWSRSDTWIRASRF